MICLVLRGRRAYGPGLVRILLQFQLRDIFKLAFVEGVLPDYGGTFGYKEEAPDNSGAMGVSSLFRSMGGEPLGGVPSLGCLCLTPFA